MDGSLGSLGQEQERFVVHNTKQGRMGDGAPSEMLEFMMRLPDWIDLDQKAMRPDKLLSF